MMRALVNREPQQVPVEGVDINTGLLLETLDPAELATRLAAAGADYGRVVKDSALRASGDLGQLLDALARVRDVADEANGVDVLERAARELCATAIYDRVMVSQIDGSTWLPHGLYALGAGGRVVSDVDESGSGVDGWEIPLASPLVEAEVVRRRLPALVREAGDEPRVYRPLIERTGSPEYVVAPVIAGSRVIGLFHADIADGARPLADLDRDLLRMYADGVGLVCERAELIERCARQRRAIAQACEAALRDVGTVDIALGADLEVDRPATEVRDTPVAGAVDRPIGARRDGGRLDRLTAREREVLAILASGATNAQLADRLTVAESTVKSHVKHILHKLGAGNRAAAIACYLRETRDSERRTR